jgi:hypothetical protein
MMVLTVLLNMLLLLLMQLHMLMLVDFLLL